MKKMPTLSFINNKISNNFLFDSFNEFSQRPLSFKSTIERKNHIEKSYVNNNELDYYDPDINEKIIFEIGDIGFDIYGNPIHWK